MRHFSAVLGFGAALASACSANNSAGGSAVRGSGGSGNGTGAGSSTGVSGSTSIAGSMPDLNTGGSSASDAGCQQLAVNFTPKTPTVFVLVDRSGSMFEGSPAPWDPLKMGALQVIQELQGDVAFGWGAFTGNVAMAQCPIFDSVPPALNNYTAINAVYSPMGPLPNNEKAETPVGEALPLVETALDAATFDGGKYILFVTDGEPDFCDDGETNCPLDDVVWRLQGLSTKSIQTIIFGLQNGNVPPATLQAFANAGAGQPVAVPFSQNGMPMTALQAYNDCHGVTGWASEATKAGQTGMNTLGTYVTTGGGTAKYFQPDPSDQMALTTQLRSVLAGVKSCTFDLGGKIAVDLTQLNLASVAIQGQTIPLDMTNGWTMATDTQLTLVGTACDTWRQPTSTMIDFNFPCEILMPK